uniref:(northern house mosquito) hypothetical protein n=2 Tax=Culex pipiens TaxID=7175 RepID=A0A8D8IP93_CULPI
MRSRRTRTAATWCTIWPSGTWACARRRAKPPRTAVAGVATGTTESATTTVASGRTPRPSSATTMTTTSRGDRARARTKPSRTTAARRELIRTPLGRLATRRRPSGTRTTMTLCWTC